MHWEKPEFEVIEMNAEIGGYQSDFDVPEVLKNPLEDGQNEGKSTAEVEPPIASSTSEADSA